MHPAQTSDFGYNTSASHYSSMLPSREKTRAAIERGKRFIQHEAKRRQKEEKELKRRASKEVKNPEGRRQDEEQKLEQEVIQAYHERQAKLQRIGSFKFDIDNELDVEILTADQVFEDLDDIKNMKEKTGGDGDAAYKSLVMAMHTRGKKKKKR